MSVDLHLHFNVFKQLECFFQATRTGRCIDVPRIVNVDKVTPPDLGKIPSVIDFLNVFAKNLAGILPGN